jgi:hypothetical protein
MTLYRVGHHNLTEQDGTVLYQEKTNRFFKISTGFFTSKDGVPDGLHKFGMKTDRRKKKILGRMEN